MYFKESNYANQAIETLELPYATFYFLDNIIISEIAQGVTYSLEKAYPMIEMAKQIYGADAEVGYISNRVHQYAVKPRDWMRFFKDNSCVKAVGLVSYTPVGLTNILFEKVFIPTSTKRFSSLDHAIAWTRSRIDPNPRLQQLIG
ncbi:hypothetical protein [Gilvibacter sp.]|uniref:hypothetical protein n=1 Tax=Gilvibacter sp. TaxID=2729997 RepID=UPI0035BE116E